MREPESPSKDLQHALRGALAAAEDASPVEAVEAVTREAGARLGAAAVSFLIADLSTSALIRFPPVSRIAAACSGDLSGEVGGRGGLEQAVVVAFEGGPLEQAVRSQTVQVIPPAPGSADGETPQHWTVLAPVTERGEAIGLLEIVLPAAPEREAVDQIARLGHILAFVVIANRRHTDLFERAQRSTHFTLAAEIQRQLLPEAYTCEAGAITLSAWLEPAANVGGDTFDYSLDRDVLHLSVTDAMGHGVNSALIASLCVGSLRNSRRTGAPLLAQAATANTTLVEHSAGFGAETFVTGVLARVDLHTGVLSVVNAGHVAPFLVRAGAVTALDLPVGLPFGLFAESIYDAADVQLQTGDRLAFVTDGMVEHRAANLDLPELIRRTAPLHPREAVHQLTHRALEESQYALEDDATVLIVDWHGHHDQARTSVAGADPRRASRPLR